MLSGKSSSVIVALTCPNQKGCRMEEQKKGDDRMHGGPSGTWVRALSKFGTYDFILDILVDPLGDKCS